jgi:type II secretory pathway pseudopilin PulG
MSTLAIVLIVIGVLLLVLMLGGFVASRRRVESPDYAAHVAAADQALEQARAEDRGWDRELLEAAARAALEEQRPGVAFRDLHLVLVDDRPGVEEDRAHVVAVSDGAEARVVLARGADGAWACERIE